MTREEKQSMLNLTKDYKSTASVTSNNGDLERNGKPAKQISSLSRKKKYILVLTATAEFFMGCVFSIMAPFYPRAAERKGMSLTQIGFIFSIFELIIFVSSPIIGNYLSRIGPKFVYLSGLFILGNCTILFGILDLCPPGNSFIILSFAIRSIQALGFSNYVTCAFAIVSSEFPESVSVVFGIMQTAVGAGLMLGPAIGGFLYELGGFGTSFYIIGAIVVAIGVLVCTFLPPTSNLQKRRTGSIFTLLKSSMVFIPMFSVCVGALGLTFMEPTLAQHLDPFNLSTGIVSLFFVIAPLLSALVSPIWGYLADKKDMQGKQLVTAHVLYGIAFCLLGPTTLIPFLPFEIWSVIISLVLIGICYACTNITGMKCMVKGALELGFEDSLDTYGLVSGLFNSIYTLGGFFGPMLGGVLAENFGPSLGYSVVGLLSWIMAILNLCLFLVRYYRRR